MTGHVLMTIEALSQLMLKDNVPTLRNRQIGISIVSIHNLKTNSITIDKMGNLLVSILVVETETIETTGINKQ